MKDLPQWGHFTLREIVFDMATSCFLKIKNQILFFANKSIEKTISLKKKE
jgi:hypothetical protein